MMSFDCFQDQKRWELMEQALQKHMMLMLDAYNAQGTLNICVQNSCLQHTIKII